MSITNNLVATNVAKKSNFDELKMGDKLSVTYYLTINKVNADNIEVRDNQGGNFTVRGKQLIENTMYAANQYKNSEKVTRTEMVEHLENAGDSVFTAVFDKQDGTKRVLVGHLLSTEPKMGRSQVIDLDITTGNPTRLVDHRTISSIIVKGTKYTLK